MELMQTKKTSHMDFVLNTFKHMQGNGVKLVYEGEINQSLTKVLAAMTEKKIEEDNEGSSVSKKVYHVMIECLQNICKHSDTSVGNDFIDDYFMNEGILMISEDKERYAVTTGNVVSHENCEKIINTLDSINALSKDEVKAAYMKQMKEGNLSDKGGAGLGFLDIAKKTGNKFQYHVEKINNEKCFFLLKTEITKN